MSNSNGFVLHRPELGPALKRGDDKLRELMGPSRLAFPAGHGFVEQGSEHPNVYRLLSGWAARIRYLPDGRKQVILLFLPDDLFGVKSLFLVSHGDAIEAITDVRLEYADHRPLRELYVHDPDVALRCNWQVVEEERRLHNWIVCLGQGGADERLAQVLLEWRARLHRAGQIEASATEYRMPLTQELLGEHLGLTAVHVNRVLKRFRDEGVVEIRGGVVRILDPVALGGRASNVQDDLEREQASAARRGRHART